MLATEEKTLLALDPISRIVPTTMARMTASMIAYSAMSCPSSPHSLLKRFMASGHDRTKYQPTQTSLPLGFCIIVQLRLLNCLRGYAHMLLQKAERMCTPKVPRPGYLVLHFESSKSLIQSTLFCNR